MKAVRPRSNASQPISGWPEQSSWPALKGSSCSGSFRACLKARAEFDPELVGLEKSLPPLREFVSEIERAKPGRLAAVLRYDAAIVKAAQFGLQMVALMITDRRRVADETIRRLGGTRNAQADNAARTAAVGWVAEGIRRATGSPNLRFTADLAQAALGGEVTIDQVRHAAQDAKARMGVSEASAAVGGAFGHEIRRERTIETRPKGVMVSRGGPIRAKELNLRGDSW